MTGDGNTKEGRRQNRRPPRAGKDDEQVVVRRFLERPRKPLESLVEESEVSVFVFEHLALEDGGPPVFLGERDIAVETQPDPVDLHHELGADLRSQVDELDPSLDVGLVQERILRPRLGGVENCPDGSADRDSSGGGVQVGPAGCLDRVVHTIDEEGAVLVDQGDVGVEGGPTVDRDDGPRSREFLGFGVRNQEGCAGRPGRRPETPGLPR